MPARSIPRSSPSPSARAALIVTPRSTSAAVMRNSTHAMFIASNSDAIGEVPGLQSVETAIGMPQRAHLLDRRQPSLAQKIKRTGQQTRDHALLGHELQRSVRGVFEMIGRQCAVARRDLAAAAVAQLIRVQPQREAEAARALEHSFGLLAGEGDAFAEHVGGFGKLLRRDRGQHVVADVTDVVVLPIRELRRQCVRTEKGLDHVDAELLAEPLCDAQHLELAREIEPIA